jgi:hypothetical protein
MEFQTIDDTIGQLIGVQLHIGRYLLKHRQQQETNQDYQLPQEYYRLRNAYEGLRIKKLKLIRRKNQISSHESLS